MEPKVISLTPSEGGKMFILLHNTGYALEIWICGCSLFYKRELWDIVLKASKSAGAKVDVPKICRFVHPLHPC